MDYKLIGSEYINFYDINLKHFKHKNGADIIFLKNNDKQLAFLAAMKTIPTDDKGIFHVLEHLILNGSKNYNVKDSFNELLKNSIQDYLNAITYNDKTVYPIGTTNEDDFIKIIDVYLDGIYNPLLREGGFMQEGIYFMEQNNKIIPNGIVYNEMKNFENDIFKQAKYINYKFLLKDHHQKYLSAGIPNEIIKINYEDIKNYYEDNYTNDNLWIFLYGDLKEEKYLTYLHNKFLKSKKVSKKINHKKINYKKHEADEINYKKDIMIGSYKIGRSTNTDLLLKSELLLDILKNYLKDFQIELDKEDYYIIFNFYIEKTDLDKKEFKKKLLRNIKNISIDLKEIYNLIKKVKFKIEEEDYGYKTRGLGLIFLMLNNILYEEEKYEPLKIHEKILSIKSEISIEFIKKILEEHFILNKNFFIGGYSFQKPKDIIYKKSNLKILNKFQNQNDSIKELSKFKIKNINELVKNISIQKIETDYINNIKINKMQIDNKNIFYLKFHFDTSFIKEEQLFKLGILTWLLNNKKIIKDINSFFEEIYFDNEVFLNKKNCISYEVLTFTIKSNIKNINKINSLIQNTFYDNNLHGFMINSFIVNEIKIDLDKKIKNDEYNFSENRCKSKIYKEFNRLEKIKYYDFYYDINKEFKNYYEDEIKDLYKNIFKIENLKISISATEDNYKEIVEEMKILSAKTKLKDKKKIELQLKNKIEIINYKQNNFSNSLILLCDKNKIEELLIIAYILENIFLFERIRLRGGAYGYGCKVVNHNDLLFYSFKDPNILKTKDVFLKSISLLKKINLDDLKLNDFKLGIINNYIKYKHNYKKFEELIKNDFEENEIDFNYLLNMDYKKILQTINNFDLENKIYSFSSF